VRSFRLGIFGALLVSLNAMSASGQQPGAEVCARPSVGSEVPEPKDLRSRDGVLKVELTYRSFRDAQDQTRYCYLDKDGSEAPTLRVRPGDWLVLSLRNEAASTPAQSKQISHSMHSVEAGYPTINVGACAGGPMQPGSTNLHFHGLTVPAVRHQDDVLRTMIQPGDLPFEYRFRIPSDEPPGLYWYHPHIHGSTKAQVLGELQAR
jgi:FtsP/CotA-like multicopper oxidase with cupredoxin domain